MTANLKVSSNFRYDPRSDLHAHMRKARPPDCSECECIIAQELSQPERPKGETSGPLHKVDCEGKEHGDRDGEPASGCRAILELEDCQSGCDIVSFLDAGGE